MRKLSVKKIGLIILALVLLLSLKDCQFRLLTKREVEAYLQRQYGQEFMVLSSVSVTGDYYDDHVWRVRLYVASPKSDPERQFFVFNTVTGFENSIPGFRNGIRDTYALDIFAGAFETRAADTEVEYTFSYNSPIKTSSVYYSSLNVTIEQVTPENLETVCALLSQAYADTFEKVQVIPFQVTVRLTYREPAWPENRSCLIPIGSYELSKLDTDARSIREYILSEADKYAVQNALAEQLP